MNVRIHTTCASGCLIQKPFVIMDLFFNRSVKISDLAAMKDLRNFAFNKGCKITDFNGSSFFTLLKRNTRG